MVNEPTSYDYFTTNYFQDRFIVTPSIEFIPYNDGTINVFNNGSGESFLKYKLSRSVNSWALGRVDGLTEELKVDARLSFLSRVLKIILLVLDTLNIIMV